MRSDALARGLEGSDLGPIHVTGASCCPADRKEEGCGEIPSGESWKGDVVVGDVTVVEGDLRIEGRVAERAGLEEEIEVLFEGGAFEDVGVMARFGPELVIEEEDPVGGCSHGGTPNRRGCREGLPMGTILRETGRRGSCQVSFPNEIEWGKDSGELYTS